VQPSRTAASFLSPSPTQISDKNYKETLNLPKTAFPMKADLVKREPERFAKWEGEWGRGMGSRLDNLTGKPPCTHRTEIPPRFARQASC
jgi:hypothetical protein